MNLPFILRSKRRAIATISALGGASVLGALLIACPLSTHAQTPSPTAAPVNSPAPSPTPDSSPASTNSALYLPLSATVQVATATPTPTVSATQQNGVAPSRTSQLSNPTTSDVAPVATQPLQVSSPDLFSPTSLAAQPQPATVTLSYNVACAGAKVLVVPMDGGQINGAAGGQTVTVGTDGSLTFSFQAPSGPGRYHVVTRLGNVQMSLPFDVGSPAPAAATGN